jgi:UPF0042 nucleotide-binding protein
VDQRPRNVRVVVITGLSGSGKSTALRALEDLGFFAVDNLPVALLPTFLALREEGSPEAGKVALVMDLREPRFLANYGRVFDQLKAAGYKLEIIFLEASPETLVRRFSQTRRTHPLTQQGTVTEAIAKEVQALQELKERADLVLDTSHLSVHELKARITTSFTSPVTERRLRLTLVSFGFKYGLPQDADLVMDVRFLPNPYFVEGLKDKDGLSPEVTEFLNRWEEPASFLARFSDLLLYLLPLYEKEGKAYLTVALGCTGGRHRSVAMVDALSRRLQESGYEPQVRHRDINLG